MSNLFKQKCATCGHEWMTNSVHSPCSNCKMTELFAQLPPHVIAETDQSILGRSLLPSVMKFKSELGISMGDAQGLAEWRTAYLREHFPEKFDPFGS